MAGLRSLRARRGLHRGERPMRPGPGGGHAGELQMEKETQAFLSHLESERGLSRNTVLAYGRDLKAFAEFLGGRGIAGFGSAGARDIADFLKAGASSGCKASSLSRRLSALRCLYGFLTGEGLARENPARRVPLPKLGTRLPRTLGEKEIRAILARPADDAPAADWRDYAVLETFYATGLRVSELAGLRVSDVNWEVRFLRCRGKGSKERVVPLGVHAIDAIRAYRSRIEPAGGGPGPEALFVSRSGRRLARESVWRIVKKAAARAGAGTRVFPHAFRHSFASHLIAHGADLRSVQEMLGHENITTTQIYTHVGSDFLREVHRKFHPRA